jgi:hypothetical protein
MHLLNKMKQTLLSVSQQVPCYHGLGCLGHYGLKGALSVTQTLISTG